MSNYDWEPTWKIVTNILADTSNLTNFRQNSKIVGRLTDANTRKYWDFCQKEEVPVEWLVDSLVGNPATVKKLMPENTTNNSLRSAYCLHRIVKHWDKELNKLDGIKVLEIGAGFGNFAELACRILPIEVYYFIDAPPMLTIQEYYMTQAGHENKCRFLTQTEKPVEKVDLIYSTMSLGEMPRAELDKYIKLFGELLVAKTGLLYLVQRTKNIPNPWASYKFGTEWNLVTKDFGPMQHFTECFGKLSG